jgi:choline dehydrogenase-like flavoprotein
MPEEFVDACVIGSGWGGSIPARRLSEAGKSVVLLERGKEWRATDFRQTQDLRYILSLFEDVLADNNRGTIPIGQVLGGTAVLYSNVMLRTPSLVFQRKDEEGRSVWPVGLTRQVFDPYYERVEKDVGVRQLRWTDLAYPGASCQDGTGDPGIWDLVTKRGYIFSEACKASGYNQVSPVPVALNNCTNCGWCTTGCKFGAKRTPEHVYLPPARDHGARIFVEHDVRTIEPAGERYRVRAFDMRTRSERTFTAKVVILAAGAMYSPVILHRSQASFARLWDRLSPQVGKKLSIDGDLGFGANFPTEVTKQFSEMYRGKIISVTCWDFLEEYGFILQDLYAIPVGPAVKYPMRRTGGKFWGLEYKQLWTDFGTTITGFGAMGIDGDDGTVLYNPLIDKPRLIWQPSAKTLELFRVIEEKVREIVETYDGELLRNPWMDEQKMAAVHPLGTCRMGEDTRQGVVDANGQVFNYPNLFITDGSAIPGALAVNPSLTIAANAERISDYIVDQFPG